LFEVFPGMLRWAAIAAVAILAAGCANEAEDDAPCPAAKVLGESSELTRYRDGPGRDPTDVLFEARMMRVVGECSYGLKGGEISVELEVVMEVKRGAGSDDGSADYGYFVAVAEWPRDGAAEPVVHSRKAFHVGTKIPPGRRGLLYRDLLEINIPRPDDRDVRNFVLYLGFELTKAELSRNKDKFGY
jgi:hypothetical protein